MPRGLASKTRRSYPSDRNTPAEASTAGVFLFWNKTNQTAKTQLSIDQLLAGIVVAAINQVRLDCPSRRRRVSKRHPLSGKVQALCAVLAGSLAMKPSIPLRNNTVEDTDAKGNDTRLGYRRETERTYSKRSFKLSSSAVKNHSSLDTHELNTPFRSGNSAWSVDTAVYAQ